MNRVTVPGAALFVAVAALVGPMGCQLIVGSGDYAATSEPVITMADGSTDGTGGGDDAPAVTPTDATSGSDQAIEAGVHVGDPCATNAGCPPGTTCQGHWCTEPCATSAACGANSAGQPNLCVSSLTGKSCVPGCQTNADCSSYGGTQCTLAGGAGGYCTTPPGNDAGLLGQIGDPCSTASDCTAPANCDNQTWCSASCTSSSDTSCGSNSLGGANHCVENASNEYICFPGCSTNVDCLSYAGTTCQLIQAGESICAGTQGAVGDPCSTGSSSPWSSCASPDGGVAPNCNNDIWCTVDCTTDASCGLNTAGQASFCVPATGGTSICFPGCTQYADCATYSGTFCQQIYGSTRGFVCAATGGNLGDPCAMDQDCTAGTCTVGWCTQPCASASDTSCGMNSEGNTNYCVFDSVASAYQCEPGCTVESDCLPYAGAICQVVAGQTSTVCSF